jgi:hypothetical protein
MTLQQRNDETMRDHQNGTGMFVAVIVMVITVWLVVAALFGGGVVAD